MPKDEPLLDRYLKSRFARALGTRVGMSFCSAVMVVLSLASAAEGWVLLAVTNACIAALALLAALLPRDE